MRKLVYIVMFIIISYVYAMTGYAEVLMEDTFTDTTKVDALKTTAVVDTANGVVTLPREKLPNAAVMCNSDNELAVLNGDGVNFYNYDVSANEMKKNDMLSVNDVIDPIGIAMGESDYSMWVLTKKEIKRYDFNGSGMSHNPYLSVTGLTDVFSIGYNSANDTLVTLGSGQGKKGVITTYKPTAEGNLQKVPQLSFDTGLDNPLALSVVPNTSDIVVAADKQIYYYSFDSSNNSYVQNNMLSVVTGNLATSLSVKKDGGEYVVLNQESADDYMYDVNISKVEREPILSQSIPIYSYSISLKKGGYEYAILDEQGNIQYWMYDQATGKMVRNKALEVAGINIKRRYASPGEYVSNPINAAEFYDIVRLTANEEKEQGASIKWSVSGDNGATWQDIISGQKLRITSSKSFIIKAVLDAGDGVSQSPPKINDVKFEGIEFGIEKVECIAITKNSKEQKLPTDIFPIKAKQGSQVVFSADTFGFTEDLAYSIDGGEEKKMLPQSPTTEETNKWIGSITFEPDEKEGREVSIVFKAKRGIKQIDFPIKSFIIINQNVIYDCNIKLTK